MSRVNKTLGFICRYLFTLNMARLTILCLVCVSILSLSSAGKNSCKRPKKIRSVFLKPQSCDCDSKTSGLLKYEDGQVLFCNGNDWKSLMTPVGSMENPGFSCKDIKARSPTEPTNGVYWVITGKTLAHLQPS